MLINRFGYKSLVRRPVVLLEVLIAFALVALCVLPLIYPHIAMYRVERKFIDTLKLDHDVSLLYASMLEKLYLNTIPFSDIESSAKHPIDAKMLQDAGIKDELPFEGFYKFSIDRKKPSEPTPKLFLVRIEFEFTPKGLKPQKNEEIKTLKYKYSVFVERSTADAEVEGPK